MVYVGHYPSCTRDTETSTTMSFTYEYARPALAVDIVVFGLDDDLKVLLIKRDLEPFQGKWALPGGFLNNAGEDIFEAALRELREEADLDAAFDGIDEITLLDAAQARERVGATGVLGATYTPHCARVHPARLVHGLARAVERRGGRIVEGTPVLGIDAEAGARRPSAHTAHGTVHADHVIRATEAWTAQLPGTSRAVIPVYSLMVATEPLPAPVWQQLGLNRGETFNDHRHLIIYGQRTADDRLVFGGRGAPYHFGSRIDPAFDADERVFTALRATVRELFPVIAPNQFSHAWGGPLGISRDWHAGVGLDRTTGLGWAGGYVGDGVGTANLAGRTLAALITGTDPDGVTRLPWVGHRSRPWEPEPLRWLEVNAGLRVMTAADREERLTGRPSVLARVMSRLLGH